MKIEFKKWVTSVLILWAFRICPNCMFKKQFALFLKYNIKNL